jgi:hypothetical protein
MTLTQTLPIFLQRCKLASNLIRLHIRLLINLLLVTVTGPCCSKIKFFFLIFLSSLNMADKALEGFS